MSNQQPEAKDGGKSPSRLDRWWEYYSVRYFFGTIVGSCIVYAWTRLGDDPRLGNLNDLIAAPKAEDAKTIVVWAVLGFAYCYAASAPMLTFHSTRAQVLGLLSPRGKRPAFEFEWNWVHWLLFAIPLTFVLLPAIWHGSLFYAAFRVLPGLSALGSLVLLGIVGGQIVLIWLAHREHYAHITQFYVDLNEARSGKNADGYIESYRHMREHSNAYAIIVLELLLASVLVPLKAIWQVALVLFIWLVPPAYCWVIGSLLEARLVEERRRKD